MKTLLLQAGLLILTINVFAQKQADRWYFGNNAGMNFFPGTPYAIPGSITTTEGTTSSSDSLGNLNFYSDGVSVWDKNGLVMPNGTGLFGNVSTTVSALAVPHPGNPTLHYLFTMDEATGTNGFCYSVIDMSLQSGSGDVLLKNVPIQNTVTEKIAAVQQLGTNNFWVTVHEWGTDAFYSYLVDSSGFQSTPVISQAGMVHTIDALEQNKYGQMKFNTCGNKLALAIGYLDTVQVLDFDPATGIFSNPITLPLGDHVYGVEFSHENSKLYVTSYNTSAGYANLVQFDLTSGVQSSVIASMTTISTNTSGTSFYYALQIGSDENIYVCASWSQFLGVVSDPTIAGPGCNFNEFGFDLDPNGLGASAALGLPAFIQSYFRGEAVCNAPVGIAENNFNSINIAPNISSGEFLLNFNSGSPVNFIIYDHAGRQVYRDEKINESGFTFGGKLKAGSYIVKVFNNNTSEYFRIVKL